MNLFIKKLNLTNFQSIKKAEIKFAKTNVITGYNHDIGGSNGIGKTALILGILFAIGGDKLLDKKLSTLVNKDSDFCEADLELQINDILLRIVRRYPTKLDIYINGEKSDLNSVSEKQRKICEYVGDLDNFKKFRIMDKSKGENILDFTSKQLTKTLMGFSEDKFQNIRAKLLKLKTEREKYNKDQVIYKHFPSEKRKQILENGQKIIKEDSSMVEADLEIINRDRTKNSQKQGEINKSIEIAERQVSKLNSLSECPTCFQCVPKQHKDSISSKLKEEVTKLKKEYQVLYSERNKTNSTWQELQDKQKEFLKESQKLSQRIHRLEARFKQLDYKYSEKDILLVKRAIESIDKFATFYIVEWIKVVEPIVNSYISKLNMSMKFIIDDKQNISTVIKRNNIEYLYEELSTGEKLFVSFVFNIAILIEQQQTGFLICDEALDSLSVVNVQRIFSIIEDTNKQLICVSQHSDLQFDDVNVIYFEKRNDVSEIKQ